MSSVSNASLTPSSVHPSNRTEVTSELTSLRGDIHSRIALYNSHKDTYEKQIGQIHKIVSTEQVRILTNIDSDGQKEYMYHTKENESGFPDKVKHYFSGEEGKEDLSKIRETFSLIRKDLLSIDQDIRSPNIKSEELAALKKIKKNLLHKETLIAGWRSIAEDRSCIIS
jgi:hypothetical protein